MSVNDLLGKISQATQVAVEQAKVVQRSTQAQAKERDMVRLLAHLGVDYTRAELWGLQYSELFAKYRIDTPQRIAAFFGNVLHECAYFKVLQENLNYSATTMARVWPTRYAVKGTRTPNATANALHRKPQAIANHTYANRMGNGPVESGDGWRYRGRGPIQTTGKNGYKALQEATGIPCVENPDLLLEPRYGAVASCEYWRANQLSAYADKGDFDGVADRINIGRKTAKVGDAHGYAERLAIYRKALNWFNQHPGFKLG